MVECSILYSPLYVTEYSTLSKVRNCIEILRRFTVADRNTGSLYEVLHPWAEVDPMPLRGISPRVTGSLAGKKIGLFANFKRAAKPMLEVVSKRLKERYPGIETILFDSRGNNVIETETENKERFEAWAKGVDAVVAAVGD
jgi:hypothetical protein